MSAAQIAGRMDAGAGGQEYCYQSAHPYADISVG